VHEVVHQSLRLFFSFDIELEFVLGAQTVAVGEAVQSHQHDRHPDGRLEAEDEVEEEEGIWIPVAQEVEGVEQHPDNHQDYLNQNEDPATDEAREVGGHAIGELEPALDFAVEIAHRRVVVLVLDQVARDVFEFSAD